MKYITFLIALTGVQVWAAEPPARLTVEPPASVSKRAAGAVSVQLANSGPVIRESRSRSGARISIQFDKAAPPGPYTVSVSNASPSVAARMTLTDEQGKEIPLRSADGQPAVVAGGQGARYFVSLDLPASAPRAVNARVNLEVMKAPLMSSASRPVPFIVGGIQSGIAAHPSVGALLIDGKMHCTGTLIGKATVLTAAHCLSGYENQTSKMSFVLGSNAFQPSGGPFRVTRLLYPDGSTPGFAFSPHTLADDIGLVYISPEAQVSRFGLHRNEPPWKQISASQTQLLFVGFGYNEIEGQQVGLGVKREAPLAIDVVQPRRIAFKVQGKSTCHGDSGGPAFIEAAGSLLQTSVTSGADEQSCTQGLQFQTRVDAFLPWLEGKIR